MSRPEHTAPANEFYDVTEASKYAQNTRMLQIQRQMSERALELLAMPARPALFAPRSLRRALLTPQANPGSLYRCGRSD